MLKKTKIKIGAAIASTIMLSGAIGTAAGIINRNQSYHTVSKPSKTIENANNYQQENSFSINQMENQSENSFQILNNTVLPKNFFSQNQLKQISNIVDKQTYHIQGNAFATVGFEQTKKVNQFMHSVQKDVINHIQQHGLQKNGLTNILVNKYHVSKTWLEFNNKTQRESIIPKNLSNIILTNKINVLNTKFHEINSNIINSWGFNEDYVKEGFELAKQEKNYISEFSKNPKIINESNNLINKISSKYEWMMKYESWNWNAWSIYLEFKSLMQKIQSLYSSESSLPQTQNTEPKLSDQKVLKKQIQVLKKQINSTKKGLNKIYPNTNLVQEIMNQERNLTWDQRTYVVKYISNSEIKNKIINLWNNLNWNWNRFYNLCVWYNPVNTWYNPDPANGSWNFYCYRNFNKDVNRIENLYSVFVEPTKTGLAVMKHTESVVDKYAQEMKGIAIASTVATGIGIAIAAAYWASVFFDFGATIPDAVAATASAAATTVAMGCMWATYSETNALAKKIESGITNWSYYLVTAYGAKGLFFKKTWLNFKNLFTQRMTYIVNYTDGVITTEVGVIDACAWADPLLAVIGTINELFAISITIAKIAINGVNNSWLSLVY